MGNRTSTTRTLLREVTADDDDKAITAETVQLMWTIHNTCQMEQDPRFIRIEPIYTQLFEPIFDLFINQPRATLLIFFTNEYGREESISIIKQKEIKLVPLWGIDEELLKLHKRLRDKAPGFKRYIMIQVYREP